MTKSFTEDDVMSFLRTRSDLNTFVITVTTQQIFADYTGGDPWQLGLRIFDRSETVTAFFEFTEEKRNEK